MDLATIIGFIAAFGIVATGILMGGPMGMFVNGASIFIVVAGSLAVVLMRSSLGDFIGAAGLAGQAFANKVDKPEDLIEKVVELVKTVLRLSQHCPPKRVCQCAELKPVALFLNLGETLRQLWV